MMEFTVEQQAHFVTDFARGDKRLDQLEQMGERMMKAADRRFRQSEVRLDRLEGNLDRLQAERASCEETCGIW
jgi:hypothetical protein